MTTQSIPKPARPAILETLADYAELTVFDVREQSYVPAEYVRAKDGSGLMLVPKVQPVRQVQPAAKPLADAEFPKGDPEENKRFARALVLLGGTVTAGVLAWNVVPIILAEVVAGVHAVAAFVGEVVGLAVAGGVVWLVVKICSGASWESDTPRRSGGGSVRQTNYNRQEVHIHINNQQSNSK